MEPSSPNHAQNNKASSPLVPPLPRDSRGSLEVFNPSSYSSRNTTSPVFRSPVSWQSRVEAPKINDPPETEEPSKLSSKSGRTNADEITTWMALKDPTPKPAPSSTSQSKPVEKTISSVVNNNDQEGLKSQAKSPISGEVGNAAQRAAEWGLVLKTDSETGKPQGVKVRTSGEEQNKSTRRDSGNSVRSSGELSDDGTPLIPFLIMLAMSPLPIPWTN